MGAVLSLLNGTLAVFLAYFGVNMVSLCNFFVGCSGTAIPAANFSPELQGALIAVGAVLAVDSLVSLRGVRMSFVLGAILSIVILAIVAVQWGAYVTTDSLAVAVLSTASILVDVVASRPAKGLSEQASPLNLPVFG